MTDVGHSRLLKFLVERPKQETMAEIHELRYEYILSPSNIESEVPGSQKVREFDPSITTTNISNSDLEPSNSLQISNMEDKEEESGIFVPVMTVTKQEAVFTKGDLKLQKISVTEDISDEGANRYTAVNPVYSEVHSEVLPSAPLLRAPPVQKDDPEPEKAPETERKPSRSRIPKFRQAVEKYKQETHPNAHKPDEALHQPGRRSSIPRLKGKREYNVGRNEAAVNTGEARQQEKEQKNYSNENSTSSSATELPDVKGESSRPPPFRFHRREETAIPVKIGTKVERIDHMAVKVNKNETEGLPKEKGDNNVDLADRRQDPIITIKNKDTVEYTDVTEQQAELDDEFDKIYDEIVDQTPTESVIESVIIDKIEDPESLDINFDEIINDYEENNIQPIVIDTVKPKNPLIKQKSLNEGEISVTKERRLSLKDIDIDDVNYENPMEEEEIVIHIRKPYIAPESFPIETEELINIDTAATNPMEEEERIINIRKPYIAPESSPIETEELINIDTAATNPMEEEEIIINIRKPYIAPESFPIEPEELINIDTAATNPMEEEEIIINIRKPYIAPESFPIETEELINIDIAATPSFYDEYEVQADYSLPYEPDNLIDVTLEEPSSLNEQSARVIETVKVAVPVIKNVVNDQSVAPRGFRNPNIDETILSTNTGVSEPYEQKNHDEESSSKIPDSSKLVQNILSRMVSETNPSLLENAKEELIEAAKDRIEENSFNDDKINEIKPNDDEIINTIVNEPNNVENIPNKNITNDITKPKSVRSKIAVFQKPKVNDSKLPKPQKDNYENRKYTPINKNDKEISQIVQSNTNDEFHSIIAIENNPTTQVNIVEVEDQNGITVEDTLEKNYSAEESSTKNDLLQDSNLINNEVFVPDHKNKDEEEHPFIGRVSRIISRIDSRDGSKEIPKKDIKNETQMKKSVSSRVALFEKQGSLEFDPKSRDDIHRPKIIHGILKPQPLPDDTDILSSNYSKNTTDTDEYEENVFEDEVKRPLFKDPIKIQTIESESNPDIVTSLVSDDIDVNVDTTNYTDKETTEPKTLETKFIGSSETLNIEERLRRMVSRHDDLEKRRTMSVVEMDLGDAVKGRVQQMIFRINSKENLLDWDKKEVITEKEKPRKLSVSEKIALFERKLTPFDVDGVAASKSQTYLDIPKEKYGLKASETATNITTTKEPISDEVYAAKIKDLNNAKTKYGSADNMVHMHLRNGAEMPVLALGTALLNPKLLKHVVGAAIDLGFRAIDSAFIYGNEREVGEAIRAKIDDGTVTREDLFIINKLWSTYHRRDLVEGACRASLDAMGLDYFDLYLVHNPMSFKEGGDPLPKIANVLQYSETDYLDAWYGLEGLVTKGLVKSIGVSNFNASQIARVYEKARIKPVINQVECHPYLTQQKLDQACEDLQIKMGCFGILGSKGTPAEYKSNQTPVIEDPLVTVMAAGLGITPAQLLVRYQLGRGHAIVIKCSSATHLADALAALGGSLKAAEVDALSALNKNKRTYAYKGMGETHRHYPFRAPF